MNTEIMFSSNDMTWETPLELFKELDEEFHFNTDVCAVPETAKCKEQYTPEIDGLKQKWHGVCWMNPPYGKDIGKWMEKAYNESLNGVIVVCLIPARTDTKYWHNYCFKASERDAIKKFRKKFPNAIIYDVFSRGRDCDVIVGRYIEDDYHYTSWIRGYFLLPSKAAYRQAIKMGRIKLKQRGLVLS